MFNKIKQLKDLRDQAKQIKAMLAQESVHADAAGGQIQIVMDGNQEVLNVTVDKALLAPEKSEEMERGLQAAINDAIKKSQRVMAQKLQGMGGLNLPGM